MSSSGSSLPSMAFAALLDQWNGNVAEGVRDVVTAEYSGHMLHLAAGERRRDEYPEWIARWREQNPGARFTIDHQIESGDWIATRLHATRQDRGETLVSSGMNFSRCAEGRVAEEWAIWSEWRPE